MRDITLGDTFRHQFTTRQFSDGVPTVLANTPVLSVLEENNATPITSGVSVSVDRASVAGLNEATIVATSGNGYENLKSYAIYISTGTVGGVTVIGEVVGQFTIGLSAAAIDLANGTDGLGALKALIDTVNTDLDNGTDGLGALKALIDTVNTDLANGTDGLGALKTLIDTVNTDLSNGTDGLGALKTLVDTVNTDLSNGTDGLGALKTLLDAIPTTAMRGTDGANTTTPLTAAQVNAQVDIALIDIHLDHLFAADYDPAAKPGTSTALLNELVENDGGVSRYTINALEQAPSGSGDSAATIAGAVWDKTEADHQTSGSTGVALNGRVRTS